MKKLLLTILTALSISAQASETITVEFGAGPSQPTAASYRKMLEVANDMQKKYNFIMEFKPGGNGVIALKTMDMSPENRLATVAPAFVENAKVGLINEADYTPVATQGDACWAIITNVGDTKKGVASLKGQKEITVGGTGFGNAAHITALILGEEYGFKVRYIVYKANFDALLNMTTGENINFVLERVSNYQLFKAKNPKLQILGINCNRRNESMPEVKTLKEQGFNTPTIFMSTVANVKMPEAKRNEITAILEEAQGKVGQKYLLDTADLNPPQFNKPRLSVSEFFNQRVLQMKVYTHRYERQINEAR
jgi:tripartite-type tricarboxylate transporter receptor subunit TctC